MAQAFRSLEILIFFPPEENVFRVREVKQQGQHLEPSSTTEKSGELVPEPIPQPFTLGKFYWGLSLFWSYRGIGWNYACPLPASSLQRPYSRDSSRRDFLIARLRKTILIWFCWDLFRTYTNLTPASIYLSGQPALSPLYADLAIWEKAIHSILIPARIVLDTERSFLMCSIMMVGIGGVMGWEGELWEPYGWPPLFGTFGDLWTSPGLATMWSKVCSDPDFSDEGADKTDLARVLPKMASRSRMDWYRRKHSRTHALWRIGSSQVKPAYHTEISPERYTQPNRFW